MSVEVAEKDLHNDNPGNVINRIRGISGRQKENMRSNLTIQFNGMRRKLRVEKKKKGKVSRIIPMPKAESFTSLYWFMYLCNEERWIKTNPH